MQARKTIVGAVATIAALGFALMTPSPAMASGGTVTCETIGHNPITGINTWACDLNASNPSGEVWTGPNLNRAASNGTTYATGTCRPVTLYYAYYISVQYTNAGVLTSATSHPYTCGNLE